MKKFLLFTNTGPRTESVAWSWEFFKVTDDIAAEEAKRPEDVSFLTIPVEQAAASAVMLDALNEVNDYLTRYEHKEQEIDYVFRSRHSVREAILCATEQPTIAASI